MFAIKVIWRGGPNWDPTETGLFDTSKTKSPIEHLIETGGQTIEETFESYIYFKGLPIEVSQNKDENNPDINWITTLTVDEGDTIKSEKIKNDLLSYYEKKKSEMDTSDLGYSLEIIILDSDV